MDFLIAYDIADPRRLRRVARLLEKHALRCQKSVFWFRGGVEAVEKLLDAVAALLDPGEDVVQAWQVAAAETADGRGRGLRSRVRPAGLVLAPRQALFVFGPQP